MIWPGMDAVERQADDILPVAGSYQPARHRALTGRTGGFAT
jgi:hypothetical protein